MLPGTFAAIHPIGVIVRIMSGWICSSRSIATGNDILPDAIIFASVQ